MNDFRHFYESAPFGSVPQEFAAWCKEMSEYGNLIVRFGAAAQAIRGMIANRAANSDVARAI